MTERQSLNEFQMALQYFRRNRLAIGCVYVLGLLYALAIFAGFLSPYSYKTEDRDCSYCPPTPIHFVDEGRLTWPYVYGIQLTFNDYHQRIYGEDRSVKYPLRLLAEGEEYKLLGLIQMKTHLWGVPEDGAIYLFGADSRGRDVFSRLFYGAQISLSIGLIGVAISFSLGLLVGGIAGYYGGVSIIC